MVKSQVYDAVFEKKFHAVSKNLTLNLRDPGCKGTAVTMDYQAPRYFIALTSLANRNEI